MSVGVTASWKITRSWQSFVLFGSFAFLIIFYFKWQTRVVREYFTQQLQGCQCLRPAIKPHPALRSC